MKKSKSQKESEVKTEQPKKAPLRAAKYEKEEVEHEDGQPVAPKKPKKGGVVALKHSRVLKNVGKKVKGNDGKSRKLSVYQAMIDEGYSEEYARQGGLRKTKSWEKLLNERFNDDKVTNIHNQLLLAKRLDYMLFVHDIKDEDIYDLMASVNCTPKKIIHGIQGTHVWFWATDNLARDKALEKIYKLKGRYAAEKLEVAGGFSQMSDADLAALIKTQKNRFLKRD